MTEKILFNSKLYSKQDEMIQNWKFEKDKEKYVLFSQEYTRNGARRFGYTLMKNISKYEKTYELIPDQGKLPLYLDLEWYSNKREADILKLFLLDLEDFLRNHLEEIDLNIKIIKLCGTREKEIEEAIYIKNSYHVILVLDNYYWKSQNDMKIFLKNFEESVKNKDQYFKEDPKTKQGEFLVDYSVYNKKIGSYQNFRMPYGIKRGKADAIIPEDGNIPLNHYFVSHWIGKGKNAICLPKDWIDERAVNNAPKISTVMCVDKIPEAVESKMKKIIKQHHPDNCISKISASQDYYSIEFDTTSKCLLCNKIHKADNRKYLNYKANSYRFIYGCFHSDRNILLNPKTDIKSLVDWDYEYEGRTDIDCDSLLPLSKLSEGGTFLLQSQKGTGKTEAMMSFLEKEFKKNPKLKVLVLTYRISLANKYVEELSKFDFHYYKNPITNKKQFNRYITLIDSIHKLVSDFDCRCEKYDVIIMDEVYSIMEGWSSSLMRERKVYLMSLFEKYIKDCSYLYLLDAHLNDSLVINTISKMRSQKKFIKHRNPQCHNYRDYEVYWNEPKQQAGCKLEDQIHLNKFLLELFDKLKKKKKICFVSSTKRMCEKIEAKVEHLKKCKELSEDFEVLVYTCDTTPLEKQKLKNVDKNWVNANLVIYSPTISAGISYNPDTKKMTTPDGVMFDEIYAYIRNRGGASYNTLVQMLARVRQLKGKQFHMFFDKERGETYSIDESEVEKLMKTNSQIVFEAMGIDHPRPTMTMIGLTKNFQMMFDETHWSYIQWLETTKKTLYYSNNYNFKKSMIAELCNDPLDTPAGKGMKLIDNSIEKSCLITEELSNIDVFKGDMKNAVVAKNKIKYDKWKNNVITRSEIICIAKRIERCDTNVSEDEYIGYMKYTMEKELGIDLEVLFKIGDSLGEENINGVIEEFTDMINFRELEKYNRQKFYMKYKTNLSENISDNYCRAFHFREKRNAINSNNELKYLQTIEEDNVLGYTSMVGINKIFDLLDRPDLKQVNLHDKVITEDNFDYIYDDKHKMNSLFIIMKKYFYKALPKLLKNPEKFENVRQKLYDWYCANPDSHLYDKIKNGQDRLDFLKISGIPAGLDDFKTSNWKIKNENIRDKFDTKCKTGNWTCSEWNMLKPETWTKTILRNNIEKCLEYSLGYIYDSADRGEGDRQIASSFNWLLKYESDWCIEQRQRDKNAREGFGLITDSQRRDLQKKKKKLVLM